MALSIANSMRGGENFTQQPTAGHHLVRDQTWRTKWLVIGGAFLAIWYSVRVVDREWMLQWPNVLLVLVTGIAPQVFLLLFPLSTRDKDTTKRIAIPGLRRWLVEFAIAIPIVIVTMIALGGLNYLLSRQTLHIIALAFASVLVVGCSTRFNQIPGRTTQRQYRVRTRC